jgi:hypothetical protein
MTEYANDAATEQALIRLTESTNSTIARLRDALEAAEKVRRTAIEAQGLGLFNDRLAKIQDASLELAGSIEFARDHTDIATKIVVSIDAATKGAR